MPIINGLFTSSINFKSLTGNCKPTSFESVYNLCPRKRKSSIAKKRTGIFSLRPCPVIRWWSVSWLCECISLLDGDVTIRSGAPLIPLTEEYGKWPCHLLNRCDIRKGHRTKMNDFVTTYLQFLNCWAVLMMPPFLYQSKAHSQLRISGLYPSAYWFGQALVDISLYFLILLLMQIMDYVFSPDEIVFVIQNLLVQVSGKNYEILLLDCISWMP